ncbi:hypothetical protein ACFQVA_25190 [Actinomadura keratinilytica]
MDPRRPRLPRRAAPADQWRDPTALRPHRGGRGPGPHPHAGPFPAAALCRGRLHDRPRRPRPGHGRPHPGSWDLLGALLSDHGDWNVAQLTTSYRVPAEIMEFVAPLAREIAPDLPGPRAVREAGADAVRTVATEPWKLLDDTVAHVARLVRTSDGSTPGRSPSSSRTTRTGWTPSAAGSTRAATSPSRTARPCPCWRRPRRRAWSTTTSWSSSPPPSRNAVPPGCASCTWPSPGARRA